MGLFGRLKVKLSGFWGLCKKTFSAENRRKFKEHCKNSWKHATRPEVLGDILAAAMKAAIIALAVAFVKNNLGGASAAS